MIVTLIGKNVLYKLRLPSVAIGNYWITDENQKKIINIEGKGGNWQITSNNKVKIIKPKSLTSFNVSKIVQEAKNLFASIELKEYSMNYLYLKDYSKDLFILYCSPTFELNFRRLDFGDAREILIGSNVENNLVYRNPLVKGKHARIFYSGGKLMLENFDTNFGTFVNDNAVSRKMKLLLNGDVIFILGLKIIILGKSIYVNNPFNLIRYDEKIFTLNELNINIPKLEDEEEEDLELYSESDYFARAPRISNIIEHEKLKIDSPPENQDKEGTPLALVLGSSLSMGLISILSLASVLTKIASRRVNYKR